MRRKAFTLVELMVILGVLMLLISMLIPAVAKARRYAIRSRMKADLLTIEQGLAAYRLDQRDYPRFNNSTTDYDSSQYSSIDGAALLCWALIAPGPASLDGAEGPGFRLRGTSGQIYGPYIDPGHFRFRAAGDNLWEIIDRNDQPIHYCPANLSADIRSPGGYISDYYGTGPAPMYDHQYFEYCLDRVTMQRAMGDTNANGQIDPGETPAFTGPFVLWCAGPNGVFGPDPDNPLRSDDVTNFTP